MKTFFKKGLITVVAAAMAIASMTTLVGCGPRGEQIDATKTQLHVSNYDGGFGTEWLYAAKDRFTELVKDVPFESGKTGVQIVIEPQKTFKGTSYFSTIRNMPYDLFFAESIYYNDLVAQGGVYDMTEIVQSVISEAEPVTIESKIDVQQREFLTALTDGKYYALPHYEMYNGLMYDIELFEDFGFYLADSSVDPADTQDGFIANNKTLKRSPGPDGQPRTDDDGLPATYDEFFVLLDRMKNQSGVRPFTWSGAVAGSYNARIASQFWADYEGVNNILLNYNLSGEAKDLVTVTDSGEVVFDEKPTQIYVNETGTNAYELARQAGRYYAVDFWRRIMNDNANYTSNSIDEYESQTQAQTTFLYSSYLENRQPNAFLCDGNWWQNEAADTFDSMTQSYGERASRNNRNFGVLPIPKVNSSLIGSGTTFLTGMNSSVFINANATGIERELAEDFLMFSTTDESLVEYTEIVGCTRPFDYDIEGYGMDENDPAYASTDYAQLSTFTQQQYEYHKNGAFFYASCSNNYALNHWNFFNIYEYSLQTRMSDNSQPMTSPYTAYISGSLSNAAGSKNYFDGIYTYFKEYWETEIL